MVARIKHMSGKGEGEGEGETNGPAARPLGTLNAPAVQPSLFLPPRFPQCRRSGSGGCGGGGVAV